jgi:hypothetical protein
MRHFGVHLFGGREREREKSHSIYDLLVVYLLTTFILLLYGNALCKLITCRLIPSEPFHNSMRYKRRGSSCRLSDKAVLTQIA